MVKTSQQKKDSDSHTLKGRIVGNIKKNMPDDETLQLMTAFFKVFGDRNRIRILFALMQSEMCVCDLTDILDMSQTAISHQMKTLRDVRLVKFRKEGKHVFYSLNDKHIGQIFKTGMIHVREM